MAHCQKLLGVLKAELAFLDDGGYRARPRYPWRPNFVFQDSPTCLNFRNLEEQRLCVECHLIDLVPEERREAPCPCRYPFDSARRDGQLLRPMGHRGRTRHSQFAQWKQARRLRHMALRSQRKDHIERRCRDYFCP